MSFAAIAIAGGAIGVAGGIGKAIGRGKANKQMDQLLTQDPTYKANPLAQQRLGLAQTLLNARMPGAASLEKNIYATQANQLGQINRNATDSSQALALASASQGQTNQAFNQLGTEEAQDYQRRYQNLSQAQEGAINEQDKVYNDQVRRFGDTAQIRGAQNANRQANWGDLSNLGFSALNIGMAGLTGGFGSNIPFGGGGNNTGNLSPMQGAIQSPQFNFQGGNGVGQQGSFMSGNSPYAPNPYPTYADYMNGQLHH